MLSQRAPTVTPPYTAPPEPAAGAAVQKAAAAYRMRGFADGKKGDWAKAVADFTEVIRLDPKNAASYNTRGFAFGQKGDWAKAVADFTEVIRLDPNNALAYSSRARAYGGQGELDMAIADYTESIRLGPKNAATYYNRASAYRQQGQLDLAIADFTEAIRLGMKNYAAYNSRAAAYKQQGELDKASRDFAQAKELLFGQPNAKATQNYWMACKALSDRCNHDREAIGKRIATAKTMSEAMGLYESMAKTFHNESNAVRRLPVRNVDPEVLAYENKRLGLDGRIERKVDEMRGVLASASALEKCNLPPTAEYTQRRHALQRRFGTLDAELGAMFKEGGDANPERTRTRADMANKYGIALP
jgi:tetratricopeptide (TPR) repeat protein